MMAITTSNSTNVKAGRFPVLFNFITTPQMPSIKKIMNAKHYLVSWKKIN